MGILGSVLWTAWTIALLVALIRAARATRWWAAVGVASAFAAAAVLAVQTDVIGDPWMGYVLWLLAGICIGPIALSLDGNRSASRHRARPFESGEHRPRARVLP
jgi:fatty acid desaturase